MSLRDKVRAADDRKTEIIDVPEWDVKIKIVEMSGRQRGEMVDRVQDKKYMYADVLIALAVDPDTEEPAFDPADRDWLADKSGAVLDRVASAIIKLSGISVEEAEKELEANPV